MPVTAGAREPEESRAWCWGERAAQNASQCPRVRALSRSICAGDHVLDTMLVCEDGRTRTK